MVYLDLFCASVNKVCSKASEQPKKALMGVTISVKLDIIEDFDHGE